MIIYHFSNFDTLGYNSSMQIAYQEKWVLDVLFEHKVEPKALSDWITDTEKWIATQAFQLNSGGHMLIVVGDELLVWKLVDALFPTVEAMKKSGMEKLLHVPVLIDQIMLVLPFE